MEQTSSSLSSQLRNIQNKNIAKYDLIQGPDGYTLKKMNGLSRLWRQFDSWITSLKDPTVIRDPGLKLLVKIEQVARKDISQVTPELTKTLKIMFVGRVEKFTDKKAFSAELTKCADILGQLDVYTHPYTSIQNKIKEWVNLLQENPLKAIESIQKDSAFRLVQQYRDEPWMAAPVRALVENITDAISKIPKTEAKVNVKPRKLELSENQKDNPLLLKWASAFPNFQAIANTLGRACWDGGSNISLTVNGKVIVFTKEEIGAKGAANDFEKAALLCEKIESVVKEQMPNKSEEEVREMIVRVMSSVPIDDGPGSDVHLSIMTLLHGLNYLDISHRLKPVAKEPQEFIYRFSLDTTNESSIFSAETDLKLQVAFSNLSNDKLSGNIKDPFVITSKMTSGVDNKELFASVSSHVVPKQEKK